MRKCLLFAALLLVSQLNYIKAQSLFSAPDTVCIRQPVYLVDSVTDGSTFYWGFCSGYLQNVPVGTNLGATFGFNAPGAIEIAKDGGNYYGFVANIASNELMRLDFGASLSNPTPVVTNFGNLGNTMPDGTTKLMLVNDAGSWYMFACGGSTSATSSFARIDFGSSLANTPSSVNFGNLGGVLNGPRGIFVGKQGGNWFGFMVNNIDNTFVRLAFGSNISTTPLTNNVGNSFGLSNPTDMVAVHDAAAWYFFVTNQTNNSISRLDLGASLLNIPVATSLGNPSGKLAGPTSITMIKDCDGYHGFVTNGVSNDLARLDLPAITGPYTAITFPGSGGLALPTSISHVIRDRDTLYTFVVNGFGNTLTQFIFPQCTNSSIASSTSPNPPPFSYDQPGTYNVYLAVNEGMADARFECKQIVALPLPGITFHNDTLICQGDTVSLFIQAFGAQSITWSPNYNITDTQGVAVKVFPEFTTEYHVVLPYANGCIVDTPVLITVSKNRADAGPDRTLGDGAKTLLGGPLTSLGPQYTYNWIPDQYINNTDDPNPVVSPPFDFTYYLEVRNTQGCYDIDTVVVHVACTDLNLPNAFAPESKITGANRFGLLNKQIVKLNYFNIYDRWGKEVFSTTDLTKEWDGTVDGSPAPYGVYVWEADGFCVTGRRFKRSGNVTLIR